MTTDRELLERAAKAAGIELPMLWDPAEMHHWNPLTDSAAALELAVKLHINIEHLRTLKGMQFNEVAAAPFGRGDCLATLAVGADPYAATRRAVVRAAAALSPSTGS